MHASKNDSSRDERASLPSSGGIAKVAAHTPGPFTVRRAVVPSDGGYDYGIGTELQGEMVCLGEAFEVVGIGIRAPAAANARLWAAAAGLLEASRNLLAFGIINPTGSKAYADRIAALEAAVAKAESR